MDRNSLTVERLRELLSYDPETGVFTWRVSRKRCAVGAVAGSLSIHGYMVIGIDFRTYKAHRLAWVHTHGFWPKEQIDHRDGNRANNRLSNLREATHQQNCHNLRYPQSGGSSGFLGVTWHKRDKKWQAGIKLDRKTHHLGYFPTAEEAHAAYLKAKSLLHPFSTITANRGE